MARALQDKQQIIADILNVPMEEWENLTDADPAASTTTADKDAREVLLAALAQGTDEITC